MTFARQSIETFLFQIAGFICNAITGMIIVQALGPTDFGQISLIIFYLTLFYVIGNFSVGLGIIHHMGRGDHKVEEFAGNALFMSIISGIGMYLAFLVTSYLFYESLYKDINRIVLACAMFLLPFYIINYLFSSILQSVLKIRSYNLITQFSAIFILPLVTIAALFGHLTVPEIITIMLVVGISGSVFALCSVAKITPSKWKINLPLLKSLIKDGLQIHIGAIATFLYVQINILMINYYLDLTQVGYYYLAYSLGNFLFFISVSVEAGLYPRVSSENLGKAVDIATAACKQVLWLTAGVAILMGVMAKYIILLYAGSQFLPAVGPLIILLPGLTIYTISKTLSTLWVRKGWFLPVTFIACLTAVVNIILNFTLIPRYGISGAAVANSLTYLFNGSVSIFLYYKFIDHHIWRLVIFDKSDWIFYKRFCTKSMEILRQVTTRLAL